MYKSIKKSLEIKGESGAVGASWQSFRFVVKRRRAPAYARK
jgi:hypothetical protein